MSDSVGERVYNVLFLCTGNSARSILGEAILNQDGHGKFRAFSAGSQPKGEVNPLTIGVLRQLGYPSDGLRSKSWDEFATRDAPLMDFVFTVCDSAAGEACPAWPGQPISGHWGIEDPAAVTGPEYIREAAFFEAARCMKNRISAFRCLPIASLDEITLTKRVREIGHLPGASSPRPAVA